MTPLIIEDSTVQRVARHLAEVRPAASEARESTERLLTVQPEILAFMLAGTTHLGAEARRIGVFLADVVVESFRRSGRAFHGLGAPDFVASLRANREMALRVGQAHDRFAERYLRNSKTLRQPALIRYVTGVLLEPEDTCPHNLPRDELGPLFIVLKSVIDVLDQDWAEAVAKQSAAETAPVGPMAELSSEPA